MIGWSKRDRKQESREFVLDGYEQSAAAIFMPGWDEEARQSGQCVRTALRQGRLDLDLPLIVVERDPMMADKIERDLLGLGFTQLVMHVGELCELPLPGPVDFAFIDLLGTLDYRLCAWLKDELAPALTKGATVAFSLAWSPRNNHFMEAAVRAYNDSFQDEVEFLREAYHLSGSRRLIPVMLIRAAFHKHIFAFRQPMRYRDTNYPMLTYRFSGFSPLNGETNGSPSLDDVVTSFTPKERKTTMTDRSEAAHKAWRTRRAAAEQAETDAKKAALSARAKQAWETRRGEIVQVGRMSQELTVSPASAAALKAWETRRANGWVHPAHR